MYISTMGAAGKRQKRQAGLMILMLLVEARLDILHQINMGQEGLAVVDPMKLITSCNVHLVAKPGKFEHQQTSLVKNLNWAGESLIDCVLQIRADVAGTMLRSTCRMSSTKNCQQNDTQWSLQKICKKLLSNNFKALVPLQSLTYFLTSNLWKENLKIILDELLEGIFTVLEDEIFTGKHKCGSEKEWSTGNDYRVYVHNVNSTERSFSTAEKCDPFLTKSSSNSMADMCNAAEYSFTTENMTNETVHKEKSSQGEIFDKLSCSLQCDAKRCCDTYLRELSGHGNCTNSKIDPCVDGNDNDPSSANKQQTSQQDQGRYHGNNVAPGSAHQLGTTKLPSDSNGGGGGDRNEQTTPKRIGGCMNSQFINGTNKEETNEVSGRDTTSYGCTSQQINGEESLCTTTELSRQFAPVPACLNYSRRSQFLLLDCPELAGVSVGSPETHANSSSESEELSLHDPQIRVEFETVSSCVPFLDRLDCNFMEDIQSAGNGILSKGQGQELHSNDRSLQPEPWSNLHRHVESEKTVPSDSYHATASDPSSSQQTHGTDAALADCHTVPSEILHMATPVHPISESTAQEGIVGSNEVNAALSEVLHASPLVCLPSDPGTREQNSTMNDFHVRFEAFPVAQPLSDILEGNRSNNVHEGLIVLPQSEANTVGSLFEQPDGEINNDSGNDQISSPVSRQALNALREVDLRTEREMQSMQRNAVRSRTFNHPAGLYDRITWFCHRADCPVQHISRRYRVPYCNSCGRSYCLDCTDHHLCQRILVQDQARRNRTFYHPREHYGRRLWTCFACQCPHLSNRFAVHYCPDCGREYCLDCVEGHTCVQHWL